ncbi:queuosine precursor transporter [Candidatus Fokinia crypta]|uniref:Probable queuosine precursor transporter n=1 Tax=Candidatus Fokinia crypta TaxID=1920990 RepID=A0ABZ0UNY4_9RICK|nr:queuosine precursor transporter [Candidatus Fokinia cryptica]WPX97841.1 VUT family protein [Candidatus Fokinia cryptica]
MKKQQLYAGFCAVFSVLIVLSNLLYQKQVSFMFLGLFSFSIPTGSILYPFTFLLSDIISEFYGRDAARFCLRLGVIIGAGVACVMLLFMQMPATSWSKMSTSTFSEVFGCYNTVFIASLIACYTSQMLDVKIFLYLKKLTKGKLLWLRSSCSTAFSLLIDTAIMLSVMSHLGIFPKEHLASLILNTYSFKLFFVALSIPILYCTTSLVNKFLPKENINECFTAN